MSKTLKYISKVTILILASAVVYLVGNVTRLLSGEDSAHALLPDTASADLIADIPGPPCSTNCMSACGCGGDGSGL